MHELLHMLGVCHDLHAHPNFLVLMLSEQGSLLLNYAKQSYGNGKTLLLGLWRKAERAS